MSSNKFGLSAVALSAVAAAVSLSLPTAVAQAPVMLTPKQASLAGISVAPEPAPEYEVANLIVKLRAPTSDLAHAAAASNMRALSAGAGLRMKSIDGMSGGASVVALESPMSLSAAKAMAARLAADPAVEYAEPDIVFKPSALPNDTELPLKQWNWAGPLDMYTGAVQVAAPPDVPPLTLIATGGINMATAWDLPVGGNEVVIAVIDTGIINHPDLNGSSAVTAYVPSPRFLAGYDFISANALGLAAPGVENNDGVVGRDPNPTDPGDAVDANTKNVNAMCYENKRVANNFATPNTWHGTRTAGIIAAIADNTIGMAGIASKANIKILPVRALGRCGGSLIDIVDAITWASGGTVAGVTPATAPTPAKVINVGAASAPGTPCPDSLRTAITAAIGRGAVVVAPTGNNYALDISAPANCPGVIGVTAHAINGESTQYTNIGPLSKQGPNPTISAPGGGRPSGLGALDAAVDNPRWAGFSVWSTGRNLLNALEIVRANNPDLNAANENNAYVFSGTSDAAAQVSGIVALVLAKKNWNSTQVTDLLVATARPFPALASCAAGHVWAGQCGAGMVDALRALQATDPPVVVTQPRAVSVPAGQTATFTVEASGVTTYQWTRAGVDIANTNSASYTTPALAATDNNVAYAVKLINPAGTTTSAAATVTVTGAANSPSGGGALPAWQLLLLSALLLAARVRVAYREQ
ncbi:MAG: S8 family serine peptidase [Burkholderiaceae bacterium]